MMGFQTKCEPGCTCHKHFRAYQGPAPNVCGCGHRRRDHRIEGPPGGPLSEVRWFECEVCEWAQFDGEEA